MDLTFNTVNVLIFTVVSSLVLEDERLPLISSYLAEVVVAMRFEKVCCSKNLQIFLYSKVQLNRLVPEVFKVL